MRSWAAALTYLCLAGAAFSFAEIPAPPRRRRANIHRAVSRDSRGIQCEGGSTTWKIPPAPCCSSRAPWCRCSSNWPATAAGQDPKFVHILHFGDSHTAADEWTGGLRDLFKAKFGDGGSGFSVAGQPFLGYRRFDAKGGATPALAFLRRPHRRGRWLLRTRRHQRGLRGGRPIRLSSTLMRPPGNRLPAAARRRHTRPLRQRAARRRNSDGRRNGSRVYGSTIFHPASIASSSSRSMRTRCASSVGPPTVTAASLTKPWESMALRPP